MSETAVAEKFNQMYKIEKQRAQEALNDVRQLLSHADEHTNTRSELVRTLRERAEIIELTTLADQFIERW